MNQFSERIALLDSQVEALTLQALLQERDIPHMIQSYEDSAYDGLFQMVKGWGCVRAPSEYSETVLDALAEIRGEERQDSE